MHSLSPHLTMVRIIHIPMQDFQTIAHLIPNFGDRVDDPPAPVEDQNALRAIFIDLLGQSAEFIQPVLFRSGRLIIYAEAAVWGQHIQHRHSRLMERCHADGLHITDIKVKVRPGSTLSGRENVRRTASYNTEAAGKHLNNVAAQTSDPELKQTLLRLAKRIRQNHKDE
jgi:hypothetical protein